MCSTVAQVTRTRDERMGTLPPSCMSAQTGRVMVDLEGGLILCLCSLYDQPLSHAHSVHGEDCN